MKQIKGMQLGAMLAAMIILMATIAAPVAVAEANTEPSAGSTQPVASSCGCSGGCSNSNITVVQLNGSEANKAVSEALKNEDVKELRNKLISRGYTPKRDDASISYKISSDNVSSTEVLTVTIPFNTHESDINASILWMKKDNETRANAMLSGTAKSLNEPMELLKSNETYQEFKNNFTAQGYFVNEEDARISEILTNNSDMASLSIQVANSTESRIGIAAIVNIKENKVVSVVDLDWGCVACTALVGGICGEGYSGFVGCAARCFTMCWQSLALGPIAALACEGSCTVVCTAIIWIGCGAAADSVCEYAGIC